MRRAPRVDESQYLLRAQSVEFLLYDGGFIEKQQFVVLLEHFPHNNIPSHDLVIEIGSEMMIKTRFRG